MLLVLGAFGRGLRLTDVDTPPANVPGLVPSVGNPELAVSRLLGGLQHLWSRGLGLFVSQQAKI